MSVLAHTLEDDGGLGVDRAIAWIEEGKRLAQAALAGAPDTQVWAREYFAIEFTGEQGIAFGMDDPVRAEKAPTRQLLPLLQHWQDFLKAGPGGPDACVDIDLT
ncbi:hypothetical protein ASB57_09260 [Bordetella sp. N]|nr:hypothetical protein ASB57_09260 [Bordetella sp. N]